MRGRMAPVERFDLQRDRRLISPPMLTTPHIACQERVHVRSFLPHADIEVRVRDAAGTVLTIAGVTGGWPEPDGALVDIGFALAEGQLIDARQSHDGRQSDWSIATAVLSIEAAFPIGLPRPEISPGPTLDCGVRVGVRNLPIDFEVTIANATHGDVGSGRVYREGTCGYNVSPANATGDPIIATATFCGESTERSAVVTTAPAPAPLPAPVVEGAIEGAEQITFASIANGAMVHASLQGTGLGSWPCYGGRLTITLSNPLVAGDLVEATQTLCSDQPPSPPGSGTVQPCSALPAPIPASAQQGDTHITILNPHPSGIVEVYANLEKIGESAGVTIALIRPLGHGETLVLVSRVGTCTAEQAWVIDAACVDPPIVADPASINVFPVGFSEVGSDSLRVDLGLPNPGYSSVRIKGLFYYPAVDDGEGAAPHANFAGGSAPLALLIHGRHRAASPSYLGYRQLQATLARQGIASLSVDHQDMQSHAVNDTDNILARARLGVYALALMAGDLAGLGAGFSQPPAASVVDFDRIGVMGHSRGGDAAVLLQHVIPAPGFGVSRPGRIRAVFPLAPTTYGSVDDPNDFPPSDVDVLVLLPAQDGDVSDNPGQKHYDLAKVPRVRTQLLVNDTNHNRYNTVWWDDHVSGAQTEDFTAPTLLDVNEHQRMLTSYGAALFQHSLLDLAGPRAILVGQGRPAGVRTDKIEPCHSLAGSLVVDSFEDATLLTNDLGLANVADGSFDATWLPAVDDPWLSPVNPLQAYYGETGRLRASTSSPSSEYFHLEVGRSFSRHAEIWIRAAEDHRLGSGGASTRPLEFFIGLETHTGLEWVSSNDVGGMIPVVGGAGPSRSVFVTLRFPLACFTDARELEVRDIIVRTNWDGEGRRYVFDDVEIVELLRW